MVEKLTEIVVTSDMIPKLNEVVSSNVESIGYDNKREEVFVKFKGGSIYMYEKVNELVYNALINEVSIGKAIYAYLKGKYSCYKINVQEQRDDILGDPVYLGNLNAGILGQ